jgi:hypothetical protein
MTKPAKPSALPCSARVQHYGGVIQDIIARYHVGYKSNRFAWTRNQVELIAAACYSAGRSIGLDEAEQCIKAVSPLNDDTQVTVGFCRTAIHLAIAAERR